MDENTYVHGGQRELQIDAYTADWEFIEEIYVHW